MRDELAGKLLDELLDWSDDERAIWVTDLARMSRYKFDHYEGFRAGERFFERLARWLAQFENPDDRRRLVEFVRKNLVFISRDEMNQVISCVYPHFLKLRLLKMAGADLGIPSHRVSEITQSDTFRSYRRRTIFLGLSDGARLDVLRRSSPELSHEQFSLSSELGEHAQESMTAELKKALEKMGSSAGSTFKNVVLVDDFYGSGTSLLDQRLDGTWKGKLFRASRHLDTLAEAGTVLEQDPNVFVVIYIASSRARQHIESMLQLFRPNWQLIVIQEIPDAVTVTDQALHDICHQFFDPSMVDEHKGNAALGYKSVALPVVLFHNTPNNSISVLWADTELNLESHLRRRALFPRYERHHADRP